MSFFPKSVRNSRNRERQPPVEERPLFPTGIARNLESRVAKSVPSAAKPTDGRVTCGATTPTVSDVEAGCAMPHSRYPRCTPSALRPNVCRECADPAADRNLDRTGAHDGRVSRRTAARSLPAFSRWPGRSPRSTGGRVPRPSIPRESPPASAAGCRGTAGSAPAAR